MSPAIIPLNILAHRVLLTLTEGNQELGSDWCDGMGPAQCFAGLGEAFSTDSFGFFVYAPCGLVDNERQLRAVHVLIMTRGYDSLDWRVPLTFSDVRIRPGCSGHHCSSYRFRNPRIDDE